MAREHARIYLSIWDDPDFTALSADAQHAYFMLMSSPDLNYAGVMVYHPARFTSLCAGRSQAAFERAVKALESARFIVRDRRTGELAVRTYVRHDGILKQPNMIRAMNRAYDTVRSETLRTTINDEVTKALNEGFPKGFPEGITKALAEGFANSIVEGVE